MFQIFKGGWRGTDGVQDNYTYLNVGVDFRQSLHLFKGAKLAIFLCIVLHMDQDGECFPSYDTIQKETGYKRAAIANALEELCEMELDGKRVLVRWRKRGEDGRYQGSNHYKVFPTNDELVESSSFLPLPGKRTLVNMNGGKSELEVKPIEDEEKPKDSAPIGDTDKPLADEPQVKASSNESDEMSDEDIAKVIAGYEEQYNMTSAEFKKMWELGTAPDTYETNDWYVLLEYCTPDSAIADEPVPESADDLQDTDTESESVDTSQECTQPALLPDLDTIPTNGKKPRKKVDTPHSRMKDAIVAAYGWCDGDITVWGEINKASQLLRGVGIVPDEVAALHAYCAKRFTEFGPMALAKYVPDYRAELESTPPTPKVVLVAVESDVPVTDLLEPLF